MSKRKREEDTPGSDSSPPIPFVTPSRDPKCENDAVIQIAKFAFLSTRYSDMKLICGDEVFYAHKLIVCPQSEYFGRACSSGFKEATEPFQFPDKWPALMRKVLEYLYTGTYTLNFEHSTVHSKGHSSNLGGSATGQSSVVPPLESTIEPSKPGLCEQESSTTAAGPGLEMDKSLCEPSTGLTQSALSASANLDAGEAPSEEVSDDDFRAYCIVDPAYFHVCMFAEADYFLIHGLKQTSKRLFRRSFATTIQKKNIQVTIKELYSNRCDYQELKEIAITRLVQLLRYPNIKNDSLLSPEITQSIPDFAHDLCTALIELADQPISVPKTPKRGGAKPAIERSS